MLLALWSGFWNGVDWRGVGTETGNARYLLGGAAIGEVPVAATNITPNPVGGFIDAPTPGRRFFQPPICSLILLRHNIAADDSVFYIQPETQPHFIGKFQVLKLKELRQNSATDDFVAPIEVTNTYFIGKFTPTRFALLPNLSRAEPQDSSSPQTQPETNVHFIGKFSPAKFSLLSVLRHNIAADFSTLQVQPATNIHFVGKFTPIQLRRLPALSLNIAADFSTPQVQPETNTHFIGKFRPAAFTLMPGLWRNSEPITPLPVQITTSVHFIGKFRPDRYMLLTWLRQHPAQDTSSTPAVHFCPDVIGLMSAYSLTGAAVGYSVTGSMAIDIAPDAPLAYSITGEMAAFSITGTAATEAVTGAQAAYVVTGSGVLPRVC
jgi:hypothetical protein